MMCLGKYVKLHDPSCGLKLPSLHFPLWRSRKSLCAPSRNMLQKAAIIQPDRHESQEGGERESERQWRRHQFIISEGKNTSERARPLDETRRDTSVSGAKLSLQPQSGWAGRMEVICGASPTDRPTDFDWGLSFPSTCMRLRRQRLRSSAPFGDTIIPSNLTAITMMNYARSHCALCALSLYLPTSSLALPTIMIFVNKIM